ncbi:uncharacterized protein LOC114278152 [Camellia sinensis]|uniref:uncharacterized protein LOC114278152 n=1 Tax=Camellia sinensis TaxID=4442 RepID=UPI001035E482|nr:uncharacterized protein LOC114278152 [Camellia sinensis]
MNLVNWIGMWVGILLAAIWITWGFLAVIQFHSPRVFINGYCGIEAGNEDEMATYSGGMNGYIACCAEDPCPPIFRSPISGMEDIMDNQVICAIYRLPDAHKHITRPPAGVIFPKKSVEIGDLKPDPALWHEDNGRKPWENRRQDPPGSISGWHLGDAAHRLVANSLQLRENRNGYRSEEKNMCVRSAEVANKQHLEGVKKIAKLEAECQRLRGLVRKKLPSPAALAQMKLEVENLGRDYGETRVRRSLLKPPSPHSPYEAWTRQISCRGSV